MAINLDGRRFSPRRNSAAGRVASDAIFIFSQKSEKFTATYSGEGFSDGHLIGVMIGDNRGELIYHSRADDGSLEAGQAAATFEITNDIIVISMSWKWLNGTRESGTSFYEEIT